MTGGGQSREDALTSTAKLLTPKHQQRVGFWNVRTLFQTGKLAQATKEMSRYNLCLLGMAEVRWNNTGKQRLSTGEVIIWSGRQDDIHQQGVALIINKKHATSILEWSPINERLLYVRLNSKYAKVSIIVAYAPTDVSTDEEKDQFYSILQKTIDVTPRHDVLLLLGDFNAKVGGNNENREKIMGKHGLGLITNNGERLVSICEENNLAIGGTLFMHKKIHKVTWTSPDKLTQSQIDHIIINNKWRHSLQDVRVARGADIGSDHSLLVAKLTLKLRKTKIGTNRNQRFDVEKLKTPETKQSFCISLRNKFSILQDEGEMTIETFNQAMNEAASETVGYRKNTKSEWISTETWTAIEERKQIKKKILSTKSPRLKEKHTLDYKEKDREVKRSARRDKRQYAEQLAEIAQTAAEQRDMKTVYMVTKKLRGDKGNNQDMPVKDEDGRLITQEQSKLERWREHFQKILNRPEPHIFSQINEAEEDLAIDMGDITLEETKAAIKKLKNGKAPGDDGICPEMLKAEEMETPRLLRRMFQEIWEQELTPDTWKKGTIIKLPKKGDLGNCNNWRGITLLPMTSKIFSRIILTRISTAVDNILRQEQAGFRKGRSCTDHIFVLRQILEQSHEWNSPLYVVFVDFEKAFDSIHRNSLWKILRHYGIPQKIVNLIKSLYENFECKVIHQNVMTDPFTVNTGVKQGCILSPILFSIAVDWLMRNITKGQRQGIQWDLTSTLEDLDYADDLGLLSHRHQDIQQKTQKLNNKASTIGLTINKKKTQVMRFNTTNNDPVLIDGNALENVSEFTYLGSKMTIDGDCSQEIKTRISKSNQAFASLRPIWKSTKLKSSTKIKIYKSNVLSILLYGSECWKTTDTIVHKLEVFQNKCLRRIFRIFWPNTISNEDLRARAKVEAIATTIKKRRWQWLGHVCRRPPNTLIRKALRWTPQGKRRRGRPRETWRRTIGKELKGNGLSLETAPRAAADRARWREILATASSAKRPGED